jgi:hypothetical protein
MGTMARKLRVLASVLGLLVPTALVADGTYAKGSYYAAYAADEPSLGSIAVDGLVARPLGIASAIVGAAVFVVTLPFSAMAGNTREVGDALVGRPARFTFRRPLGEFPEEGWKRSPSPPASESTSP